MKNNESKTIAPEVTRRDFIKTAGVSIITAPYITSGWAKTPPSDMVRHAVIGTGAWAGTIPKRSVT